ncbi:MAG: hypothetical protein JWM75_1905 [Sphingomonas bacterium]|nr:hypothetical protein [Sphingomonas bacterium]
MSIGHILRALGNAKEADAPVAPGRVARLLGQFENSRKGWFWETDADGAIAYLTDHVSIRLGCSPAEVIGRKFTDIILSGSGPQRSGSERSLSFYLSSRLPFDDLVVRANIGDEVWWSVCGEPFHDEAGRFLGFSGIAEDLTEKRRSEVELNRLARYDSLTGLPNRDVMQTALQDSLCTALHRREKCAVFLLDLDRFKTVNDTLGHPAGDLLLRHVASRLKETVGELGQVGRLGGDEFQAVFPVVADRTHLSQVAQQIVESLSRPYPINGQYVSIGVSIGIAMSGFDKCSANDLIRDADLALYAAKAAGKGTFRFFSPEMHREAADRQLLEADLRSALEHGQLSILYQPSVNIATQRVNGFEALIRWTHPGRGPVSPAKFIPLAEEIGLINVIGEWVLRAACIEAARWAPDTKVAVNLSPLQFLNRSLPAIVASAIATAGLPANRLELEITEGVLLNDDATVHNMIATIKSLGVRLALDDFGTGYSSLGYLRSVAFDKIKIDQSFVRGASIANSKNVPIIRAIVGLAHGLGMETTAEGVETQDELALVRDLGCTLVQGYIYGKPMSGADAYDFVWSNAEIQPQGFGHARAERRRLIRSGFLHHGAERLPVRIRNISDGGALIDGPSGLAVGALVELDLGGHGTQRAEIRWVKDSQSGLRFLEPLDLSSLSADRASPRPPTMLTPAYLSSAEHPHSPTAVRKERFTANKIRG